MPPAKQSDWKNEPLPAKRTCVPLDRSFSAEEMRLIKRGLMPQQQEDKWFIYWAQGTLWMHRSWTGYCVYSVRFEPDGYGQRMVSALVNREPEQYSELDDSLDARRIPYLIDFLLLGRHSEFPSNETCPDTRVIQQWSQVGRAMLTDEPDEED